MVGAHQRMQEAGFRAYRGAMAGMGEGRLRKQCERGREHGQTGGAGG